MSSQPWPYPANLNFGCVAKAKDGQAIRLDLDNELEGEFPRSHRIPLEPLLIAAFADAQWFSREQVAAIVSSADGSSYSKADLQQLEDKWVSELQPVTPLAPSQHKPRKASLVDSKEEEGLARIPPATGIAGQIIRVWAEGKLELNGKL